MPTTERPSYTYEDVMRAVDALTPEELERALERLRDWGLYAGEEGGAETMSNGKTCVVCGATKIRHTYIDRATMEPVSFCKLACLNTWERRGNRIITCRETGVRLTPDHMFSPREGYYYYSEEHARQAGWMTCDDCGKWVYRRETYLLEGGRRICGTCRRNGEYWQCPVCSLLLPETEPGVQIGERLCSTCAPQFTACEHCGRITRRYELRTIDGEQVCRRCAIELRPNRIRDYHDFPSLLFDGMDYEPQRGRRYYGVELEIDRGTDRAELAEELYRLGDKERLFHLERDGSLSDAGIEIITQPFADPQTLPWEQICELATSYGYTSHDAGTCGLHVHVSRDAFGDNDSQLLMELKLTEFCHVHVAYIERIARRREGRWATYDRVSKGKDETETLDRYKHTRSGKSRYTCVNVTKRGTIEFRPFKGSLVPATIRATLDFVACVCDYCSVATLEEVSSSSFSDVLNHYGTDRLRAYARQRNINLGGK